MTDRISTIALERLATSDTALRFALWVDRERSQDTFERERDALDPRTTAEVAASNAQALAFLRRLPPVDQRAR